MKTILISVYQLDYVDKKTDSLDQALSWIDDAKRKGENVSIAVIGNAATVYQDILDRGIVPDIVSDQTAAHDLLYGYVPENYSLEEVIRVRQSNPKKLESDAGASIA